MRYMKGSYARCQVKMRGKKSLMLRCYCCNTYNFKEKDLEKHHRIEMRNYYDE